MNLETQFARHDQEVELESEGDWLRATTEIVSLNKEIFNAKDYIEIELDEYDLEITCAE